MWPVLASFPEPKIPVQTYLIISANKHRFACSLIYGDRYFRLRANLSLLRFLRRAMRLSRRVVPQSESDVPYIFLQKNRVIPIIPLGRLSPYALRSESYTAPLQGYASRLEGYATASECYAPP